MSACLESEVEKACFVFCFFTCFFLQNFRFLFFFFYQMSILFSVLGYFGKQKRFFTPRHTNLRHFAYRKFYILVSYRDANHMRV